MQSNEDTSSSLLIDFAFLFQDISATVIIFPL